MTEIQSIQEKVNYAKDRFRNYLNSLVGLGSTPATNREQEIFNLEDAYDDGVLRRDELDHLRRSFNELDFNKLVNESKIIYNRTENKLEYRINSYDFNRDGAINQKDKDAINHVINYFNNNVNTLTDMLAMAGDKDAISKFHIKSWAVERGMLEGTDEHEAFVTKFYDQLYAAPEVRAPIEMLSKVLKLYDIGLGKDNLDDLNTYVLLLKENQPLRLLADLYRFETSEAFNVPDAQKQAMKDKFISALLNKNVPERQKLVADSIARRKIPILGGPLTAESLSNFIDRTGSKEEIAKMRIEDIAKKLGLENLQSRNDDDFDIFVNKFYNEYYISDEKGVNMTDVTNLARIYSRLKQVKGERFTLDDVDVYAYAMNNKTRNKAYSGDLNLLINLERKAEQYGLTDPIRDATIKNYIDILTGTEASDKKIKRHLQLALRTGHLPVTKEPLTIESLNEFLATAADDDDYLELVLTQMAKEREIVDNPARNDDEFDLFLSNFKTYAEGFSQGEQLAKLSLLANLYDGVKIDFNQLDILAVALKNKASTNDIVALTKFYKSDKFNIVNKAEKFREYAEILSGTNKEKKVLLSSTLRTGVIPYIPLAKEDVTIQDIDDTLAKLDTANGQIELKVKQLARKTGIDEDTAPGEFNDFVTTFMSWYNDKNIRLNDLSMLAKFYKENNGDLNDLRMYADALQEGVKNTNIATIFRFEISDTFNLIGASRDREIEKYLGILSKPAETSADKERKNILINSIRANKIYLTGEELTVASLDDILQRTTTDDDIFHLQSDSWAKKLEYPVNSSNYNNFKDTVFALRNNEGVNTTSLSRSIGFLKAYPTLSFNDFSSVALTLNRVRKTTPDVRRIIDFVQGDKFSGTTASSNYRSEKLNEYLEILESGTRQQRNVLKSAIRHGKIVLTDKETTAANLAEALRIASSEDDYHLQEIKRMAKSLDYKVGTSQYNNFKRVLYEDLYLGEKMSLTDLRYMASFYSSGVFSNAAFNEIILARKQNVNPKALRNLQQFANISGMQGDQQVEYLQILRGEQGSTKQKFLTQVFASNFIPIANARLF